MTTDTDTIKIDPCPMCGRRHRYKLQVVRSKVVHYLDESNDEPHEKTFVRLFTCPMKSQVFEVSISLREMSGFKLKDLKIVGMEENDE